MAHAALQVLLLPLLILPQLAMSLNLVFGLNPALQRSIALAPPGLTPGAVNRGSSVQLGIGGKGQDVYVAAHSMQCTEMPVLAQFLGLGAEGDLLLELLQAKCSASDRSSLSTLTVRTQARLRNAITLLNSQTNEATEIVEPSGAVSPEDIDAMRRRVVELVAGVGSTSSAAKNGVAIMGSMPPGCPADLYAQLVPLFVKERTVMLLDVVAAIVPTIAAAIKAQTAVTIVKLNVREVLGIVGMAQGGSESASSSGALIFEGCTRLAGLVQQELAASSGAASRLGSSCRLLVCATDGPFQAHMLELEPALAPGADAVRSHWVYSLPPLPRPLVNPIGAGDAVSSGTLMAATGKVAVPPLPAFEVEAAPVDANADVLQAFRWGLACGAASCMTGSNSVFDKVDADALYPLIRTDRQK